MGDPKKLRKNYSTPAHPWNAVAIEREKILTREYGLQTKKEIYRATSFVKKYRSIAKRLFVDQSAQALKEKEQMITKLGQIGLLSSGANPSDVLGLEPKDLLERRLQTVVFRKGLARSIKQARQFITHRHIKVGDKEITAPSYIVSVAEEELITFKDNSVLFSEDHPERATETKEEVAPKVEEKAPVAETKKVEAKAEVKAPVAETKKVVAKAEVKAPVAETKKVVAKAEVKAPEAETKKVVAKAEVKAPVAETKKVEAKVEEKAPEAETKKVEAKVEEKAPEAETKKVEAKVEEKAPEVVKEAEKKTVEGKQ